MSVNRAEPPRATESASREKTAPPPREALALTLYRPFFLTGILLLLTAGAGWGTLLLWEIAGRGSYTSVPIHHINAHGQVQVFGWMGMFIMGFAYQMLPGMWSTRLVSARLAETSYFLMLAGLILSTGALAVADGTAWAASGALLGGSLQLAAVGIFATILVLTFRRSPVSVVPWIAFVFGAVFWFILMTAASLWYVWSTLSAPGMAELIWRVATYQSPLRDLQFHGLALFLILGVSMRLFPLWFKLEPVPARRAWPAFVLLAAAVLGEVVLFLIYRWTGSSFFAAWLLFPWILLTAGIGMVVLPWRLWRPFPRGDRSAKFVRAAYAWLAVSLVLLLFMPAYQQLSGLPFSHAYLGAVRHSFTVGFISQMILAVAGRVIPALSRVPARSLPPLWGPFLLFNGGGILRTGAQILSDLNAGFFALAALGGLLNLAAFAWWGLGLARMMLRSLVSGRHA